MIKAGNSLLRNSLSIFITRFFPSLANLLVMIWYSRHLPEASYGQYQNFWIQLYVIAPIACFGIHVLVVTYSPSFITKLLRSIKLKQYIGYTLWVTVLGAVFAMLQYGNIKSCFVVPFLFMLCYAMSILLESSLIVYGDYKSLITINILYSAAYLAIHWYVLMQGFSLQALFVYLLFATVVKVCMYIPLAMKGIKRYKNDNYDGEYAVEKIHSLLLHLGLYDVIQVLFSYIDKFIISLVLLSPVSAIYFNGSQNIPFLPLLISAAGSAVLMQLAGGNKTNERVDIIRLMNQLGIILSCIVFPVFFFLFFFRTEFILTIFSDKYAPAIPVFMISILVLPLRAYHFTTILQRLHKGAIINIGAIGDLLLACMLMYPLYQWLGLRGVALSFVISTYVQAAFYLFYSAKYMKVNPLKLIPYTNWVFKFIVFAILFIIIHYLCKAYFTVSITLLLGGVVMIIMIITSLLFEFVKQKKYGWS